MKSLRKKYFNSLADILLEQNFELYYSNGYEVDTWTLSNHLQNSLDYEYVDQEKMAELALLLQNCLVNDYEQKFENLLVKQCFIINNKILMNKETFDQNAKIIENL